MTINQKLNIKHTGIAKSLPTVTSITNKTHVHTL